ncbi:MAG: monofunctional biosynthetic peptidoglycan transglycosylase [Aquisalimonadaceae bacterium]
MLAVIAATVLLVFSLRWIDPPTSAFMLQHDWSASGNPTIGPVRQQWVSWADISPQAALAVVASEDQHFPHHWGFDFQSLGNAIADYRSGGRLRGASTISQQVAKNLFLWPRRSMVRKGIEAYFTLLIETLWSKRRILEVYLNIAQFGSDIYGIEAASLYYFGTPAAHLTPAEAALLAAVLPNPRGLRVDAPSSYVRQRQSWILSQMRALGGTVPIP